MKIPIGRKIKTLRTLHEMYQQELARKTGIHRSLLVAIEKSQVTPGPEQLEAIEAAFGLKFDDDQVKAAFATLAPQAEANTVKEEVRNAA